MTLSDLKIIKQVLCPKDEDYEKPCISPQFLEQELDMLFEDLQYNLMEKKERIVEFEKENKDLKALRKYEITVANAEIEKLQAENAELKARADEADLDSVTFFNQLSKAKEIIKDMLDNGAFTKGGIRQRAMDFLEEN